MRNASAPIRSLAIRADTLSTRGDSARFAVMGPARGGVADAQARTRRPARQRRASRHGSRRCCCARPIALEAAFRARRRMRRDAARPARRCARASAASAATPKPRCLQRPAASTRIAARSGRSVCWSRASASAEPSLRRCGRQSMRSAPAVWRRASPACATVADARVTAAPRCAAPRRTRRARRSPRRISPCHDVALPALRSANAPRRRADARLQALIALIARLDDTCLLYRGGRPALAFAQRGARAYSMRARDGPRQGRAFDELERGLLARNASPGGCADLLAATLYSIASLRRRRPYGNT